jgi:hypothetical protein
MSTETDDRTATTARLAQEVGQHARQLQEAFAALIRSIYPETSSSDAMVEVITAGEFVHTAAAQMRTAWEEALLAWFIDNEDGTREITIGERQYYGERVKKVKLLDHVRTGLELYRAFAGERVMTAVGGDLDAWGVIETTLREFLQSVVSSSGPYKDAAAQQALAGAGVDAGQIVHAFYREQPSDEAIELLRAKEEGPHWIELWPSKLTADGKPKPVQRLGIGNTRFQYRRGGGTKADFDQRDAGNDGARPIDLMQALRDSLTAKEGGDDDGR